MFADDCPPSRGFGRATKNVGETGRPSESLDNFASRIEQLGHLRNFAFEIIDIGVALFVIKRDDGGAAANSRGVSQTNMEIEREAAFRFGCFWKIFSGQFRPNPRR